MTFETVDLQIKPPFAYITFNRPEVKNAINRKLTAEIKAAFDSLRDNHDVRAIVLSGAGGTFCAGGDLNEMREAYGGGGSAGEENFEHVLTAINTAPQVVIAKIEGAAMGGGFGMVCVADIAVATESAKMGLPEVKLGIAPSFISPYVIERIGFTRARELMLTGRRFDGNAAKGYGLVHDVVAPDAIDAHVDGLLDTLRGCSPNSIRKIKELMFTVKDVPFADTVEYRANLLDEMRTSDDAKEGIAAFMGKRKPVWANTGGE